MTTERRHSSVMLIMAFASLMGAGTSTMVNVALPDIQGDLHVSFSDLQWIVNAFTVVAASCILPATALGTNFGRRRMYVAGMCMVAAGSGCAGLAPNLGILIGARVLQALGAAIVGSTSLGIIVHQYPDDQDRRRAIGLWAAGAGIGLAIGPLSAGALIGSVGWRGVFGLTAALALFIAVLGWSALSGERHGPRLIRVGIDYLGAGLAAIVLAALSYGFIEANQYGWDSPRIVVAFAVTTIGSVLFVRLEIHQEAGGRPVMVGPSLWRRRRFAAADIGGAVFFFALYGNLFLFSVYCEAELNYSAFQTGLVFLPMTGLMAILAAVIGRVTARFGVRAVSVFGFFVAAGGSATLIDIGSAPTPLELSARFAVMGVGFGLISAPLTFAAMHGLPEHLREPASSTYNAVRQVGAVVSVAVLGAIAPLGAADQGTRFAAAMAVTTGLLVATMLLLARMLRANSLPVGL